MNSWARTQIGTCEQLGLPEEADVVVIGSGAAGLMAALAAASEGATVLVVESECFVGGTSAISGGAIWVPNHGYSQAALGSSDSPQAARTYLLGQGRGEVLAPDMIDGFIKAAPHVARLIEKWTRLSWIPVAWPDYASDISGASDYRSLFPGPFDPELLGEAAGLVRPPKTSGMARNPLPIWIINQIQGVWLAGRALVGSLLEGCLRRGVVVRTEARATRLVTRGSGVDGVAVDGGRGEVLITASRGVILASGGFEGANDLAASYLGASFPVQVSPGGHTGDAMRMSQEVGAELIATEQAWWQPAIQVPGEQLDGTPIARLLQGERALPHTVIVNSQGERFANEAAPYSDLGAIMRQRDPVTGDMINASAWMIFDEEYHRRYGFLGAGPGGAYPSNVVCAETLEDLAAKCRIDPEGLLRTVRAFNPAAAKGQDPWFNRGASRFERFFGDHNVLLGRLSPNSWAPAEADWARRAVARMAGPIASRVMSRAAGKVEPERMRRVLVPALAWMMKPCLDKPASGTLGPIDTPPYYAVQVEATALGTVGGPRTDASGRVLNAGGAAIPGLYAVGNAGGAPTHGFYGGAGGTLSLALTFGYLAGVDAARRHRGRRSA